MRESLSKPLDDIMNTIKTEICNSYKDKINNDDDIINDIYYNEMLDKINNILNDNKTNISELLSNNKMEKYKNLSLESNSSDVIYFDNIDCEWSDTDTGEYLFTAPPSFLKDYLGYNLYFYESNFATGCFIQRWYFFRTIEYTNEELVEKKVFRLRY